MLKTCVNSAWSPSPLGVDNWPVIAAHQSILKIHTIHSATVGDHIWHNYFSGPFIHASLSDLGKMIPDQCHYPTVLPTDNIDLYHWQSRRCFSPVTEAHGRSADAACLFQCSWYGRRQSLWCLLTEMPPAEHDWWINFWRADTSSTVYASSFPAHRWPHCCTVAFCFRWHDQCKRWVHK